MVARIFSMPEAAKRKRGRPPTGETEQVWGRVSADVNEWISARAEQLGISKARVVGAMLRFALEHKDELTYPTRINRSGTQQELPLDKAS
jgi:hypothetical protein